MKRAPPTVAAGLDPRVEVRFEGEDEEQKKAQAFLVKALGSGDILFIPET
jgi:hypothetical protein